MAKKLAKKTVRKSAPKADPATPPAGLSAQAKRGAVLISRSISDILKFVGGDPKTIIQVSKRSLVDAKTKGARAAAALELDGGLDSDLA